MVTAVDIALGYVLGRFLWVLTAATIKVIVQYATGGGNNEQQGQG